MNLLYIVLIPLFSLVVHKRISFIVADIKNKNHSKLKADVFFLALIIVVIILLLYLIQIPATK